MYLTAGNIAMQAITSPTLSQCAQIPHASSSIAIRGNFIDFTTVTTIREQLPHHFRVIKDGLLIITDGQIEWFGDWAQGEAQFKHLPLTHYADKWLLPGFIDTHIHYPQTEMIGAYGEQLLDWLTKYTYPTELKFADKNYASSIAEFFIEQLLANGVTTALVYATVHSVSVEALFEVADRLQMCLITGKVLMDRHAPPALCDTPQSAYEDSKALIEKWHGRGRLFYAITPRFAPTSTPEQLCAIQQLHRDYPDTYIHTHLSENADEIAWVHALFPQAKHYVDVYHHYQLTGTRSIFAHGIHLDESEWQCLADTQSALAFCPTSNLFLGSGLFNLAKAWQKQVRVGMGSDVGAGTSFSMFQTLNEAYKVMQLQGYQLSIYEALYLATLGAADSLSLADKIGNFDKGKAADFIVIDLNATPLQAFRQQYTQTIEEKIFTLLTLGDDRNIYATYVAGNLVYQRD